MNGNEKNIEMETFSQSHRRESEDSKKDKDLIAKKVNTVLVQENGGNGAIIRGKGDFTT